MTQPAHTPEALERAIRQRVESLSYLPTTAAVAMNVVDLGKDPDADPAEYSKVISSDSSLSTKLLALANSSWFGVRNKVTRPNVAVNLLGLGIPTLQTEVRWSSPELITFFQHEGFTLAPRLCLDLDLARTRH